MSLANIQTDVFQVTLWVRELPRGVIVPYYSQLSAGDANFELLMLFEEHGARAIDCIISSHSILRMPSDVIRENLKTASGCPIVIDRDLSGMESIGARGSNTIKVTTDDEDDLEALLLALLLSRRRPLDIVFDRRARILRTP